MRDIKISRSVKGALVGGLHMTRVVRRGRHRIFARPRIRIWTPSCFGVMESKFGPFGPENGILGHITGISQWPVLELENESGGGAEYGGFSGLRMRFWTPCPQLAVKLRSRNIEELRKGGLSTKSEPSNYDEFGVNEYMDTIHDLYLKHEHMFLPDPQYMETQTDVNERMRAILVDWLVEVFCFENPESAVSRPNWTQKVLESCSTSPRTL